MYAYVNSKVGKSGKEEGIVLLGLEEEQEFDTRGRRNRGNHVPGPRSIKGIISKGPEVQYCMAHLRPWEAQYQQSKGQNKIPQILVSTRFKPILKFRQEDQSSFETEVRHASLHGLLWA